MPQPDITAPVVPIAFDPAFGRRFIVSIDTEEDFDWHAPFSRDDHSLASTAALAQGQRYFEDHAVAPLYLIDFPVAQDGVARDILGRAAADGRAELGLQLHPWVTPPFDEKVTIYNSFAGNLPIGLERAKLAALHHAVATNFAVRPRAYRAGRYGLGPHSLALLAELGIACDTSMRAGFDYSASGGPDYSRVSVRPHWTGPDDRIAELPLTSVYVGGLRRAGRPLFHGVSDRVPIRALLARTRLLERIPLTPEGTSAADACRAIHECAALDLPLVMLSFHSPSLVPGNTPYVRDAADLARFYAWWDGVLRTLDDYGYAAASLGDALAAMCGDRGGTASSLAKRVAAPLSPATPG